MLERVITKTLPRTDMSESKHRDRKTPLEEAPGVSRRLLLGGSAAAGAALLAGCKEREVLYLEQAVQRTSTLPGASVWKKSVCRQCPASCGVTARVVDGDVRKLEGDPDSATGKGGVCALGHSALQELYHPERPLVPMRRSGDRSSPLEEVSWEEALADIGERLASIDRSAMAILTARADGPLAMLWQRVAEALGAQAPEVVEPVSAAVERRAAEIVFGRASLVTYDLGAADWVLGVGAPFLDAWRSPVAMAAGYANLVAGRAGRRGRLIQAEARHSLTAAKSDLWLPIRPGSEGVLVRALAEAVIERGGASEERVAAYRALFPSTPPTSALDLSRAAVAERSGLSEPTLARVEKEMLAARKALVVTGGAAAEGPDGAATVVAGLALARLLGALEPAPGEDRAPLTLGVAGASPPAAGPTLAPETQAAIISEVDALAYTPSLRPALEGAELVIAIAGQTNLTTELADFVLPAQVGLERLQAVLPQPAAPGAGLVLAEPAIKARGEARHPGDIALALVSTLGAATSAEAAAAAEGLWESTEDAYREVVGGQLGVSGRAARRAIDDAFESGQLARAAREPGARESNEDASAGASASTWDPRDPAGQKASPVDLELILFESVKARPGVATPWLFELPDPLSAVTWGAWAEISPADAAERGIHNGDLVRLSTAAATADVAAVITPAARPGTIAVPVGFERGYGERGLAANALLDPARLVSGTRAIASGGTSVAVEAIAGGEHRGRGSGGRMIQLGRGLREPERIPAGWAPHEPLTGHAPNDHHEGGAS